ncbi:MAG: hypothetical protein LBV69_01130 [Bacteroidales bacterium]|jgi:hypothetical protein|nr:hypothetical protein [Bacteroidales bacterium]
MENIKIIKNIIELPKTFILIGNTSIYNLLYKTGYFSVHNQISENDFYFELLKKSECIESWENWSNDKHCDSGWYFKEHNQKYLVGYYDMDKIIEQTEYNDKTKACAIFIKKEIEDIMNK